MSNEIGYIERITDKILKQGKSACRKFLSDAGIITPTQRQKYYDNKRYEIVKKRRHSKI